MNSELLQMTACDLGRAIEKREVDPVDLTETYLEAIKTNEYGHRIYARTTEDRAMAEAQAASKRANNGIRLSLLDGVPISWKDLFDSANVVTEAGSALLKDRLPKTDATVLVNATHAGLVCLGKTHMTELAFSGLGLNPSTQTPPNICDPDLAPGGSSSGAAASVAYGLAAAGIGSDTGGSVRTPAAWNNLVGLKTTAELMPKQGVVPLCESFDNIGPLCRSVEDAAHLTAIMAGQKAPGLSGATLEGKHFAVLETVALDDCAPEVLSAFNHAIDVITQAGAFVTRIAIPEVQEAMSLAGVLYTSEAYAQWHTKIEANPEAVFSQILERFRAGGEHKAIDYINAWQKLRDLRERYFKQVAAFDAVLVPTVPILAPDVERLMTDEAYFIQANLMALRNTRIGNLMGGAVLTLPTNKDMCGISLMTPPFEEAKVLRLGMAVEGVLKS